MILVGSRSVGELGRLCGAGVVWDAVIVREKRADIC